MALLNCAECTKPVSDTAIYCPHCGARPEVFRGNTVKMPNLVSPAQAFGELPPPTPPQKASPIVVFGGGFIVFAVALGIFGSIIKNSGQPAKAARQGAAITPGVEAFVCKAAIATIMGRDYRIMSLDSVSNGVHLVSYVRSDDNTRWSFKCKLSGNQVIWGNPDGRWRDLPADGKVVFEFKNAGGLEITEIFSDGSRHSNTVGAP